MEGHVLCIHHFRAQFVALDELLDVLGAVVHGVVAAQVRVFVGQGVEAVRALRHDFLHLVAVQRVHVLLGERAVQVFVAQAPRRVAGTALLRAQNGEPHAGVLQDVDHRGGDLLVALVERARAADPVQHLGVRVFGDGLDAQAGRPIGALVEAQVPGVGVRLQALEHVDDFLREAGFHHHVVAPHVHDALNVLDVDRAALLAPAARGAAPDDVFGRHLGNHVLALPDRQFGVGRLFGVRGLDRGVPHQKRRLLDQMLALHHDQLLGVERFVGMHRRTVERAPPALQARRHVQQLLPVVLLDLRNAEGLRGLEVRDRLEPAARAQIAEEDVDRRQKDVPHLGERDQAEERADDEGMDPPHDLMGVRPGVGQREDGGERHAGVRPARMAGRVGVNADAFEHQAGQGDQQDQGQRQAVAHAILEVVHHVFRGGTGVRGRPLHVAAVQKQAAGGNQQHPAGVQHELIDLVERAEVEIQGRVVFERDQAGPDEQPEERDEQGQMVQAAGLLADDVALPEGFQQKPLGPFRDVVDAIGRGAEPDAVPPRIGQDQRRAEERREQEQVHDDLARQRDVPQNLPGDLLHIGPPNCAVFVSALHIGRKCPRGRRPWAEPDDPRPGVGVSRSTSSA